MRVRIAKTFYYASQKRNLKPGDVVNIPDSEAHIWLHHGMAMLDKTVDVPENKGIELVCMADVEPASDEQVLAAEKKRERTRGHRRSDIEEKPRHKTRK